MGDMCQTCCGTGYVVYNAAPQLAVAFCHCKTGDKLHSQAKTSRIPQIERKDVTLYSALPYEDLFSTANPRENSTALSVWESVVKSSEKFWEGFLAKSNHYPKTPWWVEI